MMVSSLLHLPSKELFFYESSHDFYKIMANAVISHVDIWTIILE